MRPFLRRFHALRGLQLFALFCAALANVAIANGAYPDANVSLSGDTRVTPDATPANTTSVNVSTSTNFKGTFAANPTTGVVTVTDAHPAGSYPVMVTAFGPGGTTTKTFTLRVTGTPCGTNFTVDFINGANVNADNPESVAIGDFNGDGKQDLAVVNLNWELVSIRLGDGLGGFTVLPDISVAGGPASIAIGDFNGDGKQDLATANYGSTPYAVSIRLGNGLGGFNGQTEITVGPGPGDVVIGDFNGDGKQDFATSNNGQGLGTTASVRLGNGLGGFSGSTEVSVGTRPQSIAIGDFNGDGKQDLALPNFYSNTVSIRLGDGLGGFSGSTDLSLGTNPTSVAIGDFNDDGRQDLAVTNANSATVSIFLGDGLGGFTALANVGIGLGPTSVVIGDFNGDGKQDLAVGYYDSPAGSKVAICLGDGLGGFSRSTDFSVGSSPYSVAIGDFNRDGRQDLAVANYGSDTVSIRLGQCVPVPTPTPIDISGTVSYCTNPVPGPVPNVTLTLTGSTSDSTSSDGSGNYTLSSLPSGGSYTVTPTKAALAPGAAGIDTVDVIAAQKHFLLIGTPLSGCHLAAADVNGTTTVNTADVIAIQRFSLGLTFGFANAGTYQFTPASRSYSPLTTDQTGQNYDTLVFGDVAAPFVEP